MLKMKVYARHGVAHLWLVDPLAETLETFSLDNGRWTVNGLHADEVEVRAPPFDAVPLN